MNRTLIVVFAVLLALASPAVAKRGNENLKQHCSSDAATFCSEIDPGGDEMAACFAKHRQELSPGCGRAMDAYQAQGGK